MPDGRKVACVFWGHRKESVRFVFGSGGRWSDVKEVLTPWEDRRLWRAVEASPGTIGMLCKIGGNPSYFEVAVVRKGQRIKTVGVPQEDSSQVPAAIPDSMPGKEREEEASE